MTVTRVLGSGISRQCGVRALMSATKMIALFLPPVRCVLSLLLDSMHLSTLLFSVLSLVTITVAKSRFGKICGVNLGSW